MNLSKEQKIGLAIILPILGIFFFVFSIWQLESSICGHWDLSADLCRTSVEQYSKLTAILSAVITLVIVSISAFFAVNTYRKNATLEHAKWLFNLYEKFYEKEHLKDIRNKLDCKETNKEVENFVKNEPFEFTDYLNFFEFVAFLKKSNQITFDEIDDLFGYYLSCISRHESVRNYLKPNGYELLDDLLNEMAARKNK